jgi:hypothetical protein
VTSKLQKQLSQLEKKHQQRLKRTEVLRKRSRNEEQKIRKKNVKLDQLEEDLKVRSEKLLAQIRDYNERIRQLGRGFGFFAGFFKMRGLAAEREALEREQSDVAARIEGVRNRWADQEKEHTEIEQGIQEDWVQQETEAAALQTKIDYCRAARPRLIRRSTIESVLFEMEPDLPAPQAGDPPCPRCKTPNPEACHFCRICAQRLTDDRPDLEGSIRELAEVNRHHQRFSEGMQACQEIIGLVRGIKSGLEAFMESVQDVKNTANKYNLTTLEIDVPKRSISYGEQLDVLKEAVSKDQSLHPVDFAEQVNTVFHKVFTEKNIQSYFETMGKELSQRANRQW